MSLHAKPHRSDACAFSCNMTYMTNNKRLRKNRWCAFIATHGIRFLGCVNVPAWWIVKNMSAKQLCQNNNNNIKHHRWKWIIVTILAEATNNQCVKPREAVELCFVAKCVILCQNKLAYCVLLHGANWGMCIEIEERDTRKKIGQVDAGRCLTICGVWVVCSVFLTWPGSLGPTHTVWFSVSLVPGTLFF